MNALQRYYDQRDREESAFMASPLGQRVRNVLNYAKRYTFPASVVGDDTKVSLAAEYAFGYRWAAFYALRSLQLTGFAR